MEVDALSKLGIHYGQQARRHVRVPADELGGGGHADVSFEVERALVKERHDAVVNDRQSAGSMSDVRKTLKVANLHARIRGRFQHHELRLSRPQRPLYSPAQNQALLDPGCARET